MKTSEIITLINAGYTKADIDAMETDSAGNNPAPDPAKDTPDPAKDTPDPAPDTPAPDAAGGSAPEGSDVLKALQSTVAELAKSVKAMQAANIAGARTDPPAPKATAESAIMNFMKRM